VLELVLVDQPGEHHPYADVGGGDESPGGHRQAVEQGQVEAPEPVQGRDDPDERGPQQVVGDHHPPGRPAVQDPAEQRAGNHRRQPGAQQDQPDGRARPGAVEHEPHQGDGGELVAGPRQQQAGCQPPHRRPAEDGPAPGQHHGPLPQRLLVTTVSR
jgi:hypothetical protein